MRWIRTFEEGDGKDKALLGGKGAGLCEMTRLGLPVPTGFTITTEACRSFFTSGEQWPEGLQAEVDAAVAALEARSGKRFGDADHPLLVSVRSGAAVSMPGMMDTVLNLGLNRSTTKALAKATGNHRFAWDSYRRFVQMFGDVVLGIHYTRFNRAEEQLLAGRGHDELDAATMEALCARLEEVVTEHGQAFPSDPREQLRHAIDAVFRSWNSHRARYYRKSHGIPDEAGTAVNVQMMVFGNMGDDSGTGVAFTRNPKSGAPGLFGEWLAQRPG
jgi:pyruvate,orthophosphate dikinase